MNLHIVNGENFKLDGGACFGVVPKLLWQNCYPADENNLIDICTRCLLIEDNNRLILIDTGLGSKQDEKFYDYIYLSGKDNLIKSFKKHGFCFDDVTDVIITHLHYDHCGGAISYNNDRTEMEYTFKNAVYWVSKSQLEWANNPNPREKASYFKVNLFHLMEGGQLKLITEEQDFTNNIYLQLVNGHTEGQLIPYIRYKDKTIVFAADFIPSSAHVPLSYMPGYDIRPLVTLQEKEKFLRKAVDENYILFFEHDYYHECCTVQQTEKGVKVKDKFSLHELF